MTFLYRRSDGKTVRRASRSGPLDRSKRWELVTPDEAELEPTEEPEEPAPEPPNRYNGSRVEWAEYAEALGVSFAEDASRDDIVAAVDEAIAEPTPGEEGYNPDPWADDAEGNADTAAPAAPNPKEE